MRFAMIGLGVMPLRGAILVALLSPLLAPDPSQAQGFVSPILGYDYGGDSICPKIRGCEGKGRNLGVSFGSIGRAFGSEFEIASAKNFFRGVPDTSSSVRTMIANTMFAPQLGPLRPYALIGIGRFTAKVEDLLTAREQTDSYFGWNLGMGLMIFPGRRVGIRGDLRFFHAIQELELPGIDLPDRKVDFGRASAGVVFRL